MTRAEVIKRLAEHFECSTERVEEIITRYRANGVDWLARHGLAELIEDAPK